MTRLYEKGGTPVTVAYLLYNERPFSGLVRSQVIALIEELKKTQKDIKVDIIAVYQPWIKSRMKKELLLMEQLLQEKEIEYYPYFFALPERHLFNNRFAIVAIRHYMAMMIGSRLKKYDIIHGRGYFAGFVSSLFKMRYQKKVVFDPRSLFPEENVTRGKWKQNSSIFNFWKKIEKDNLSNADASVGVSSPLCSILDKHNTGSRVHYIPCCVDTGHIRFLPEERVHLRHKYGWDGKLVFLYVGSLEYNSWNNVYNYLNFFKKVVDAEIDGQLVIISQNEFPYQKLFEEIGLDFNRLTTVKAHGKELSAWLSAADFGLQLMGPALDQETRLGVKFVEYLSAGLPVVVNSFAGAAAEIVTQNNLGVLVNDSTCYTNTLFENYTLKKNPQIRELCRGYAEETFSVEKCAERYGAIYKQVVL